MVSTNNNPTQIFCATFVDGQAQLGRTSFRKSNTTVQKISTTTQETRRNHSTKTNSTGLQPESRNHTTPRFLRRINNSLCSSHLCSTTIGTDSTHSDDCSQNPSSPNQITLRSSPGTMRSIAWSSTFGGNSCSHQRQPFPETRNLCLDRLSSNDSMVEGNAPKMENLRSKSCCEDSKHNRSRQMELCTNSRQPCRLRLAWNLSRNSCQSSTLVDRTIMVEGPRNLLASPRIIHNLNSFARRNIGDSKQPNLFESFDRRHTKQPNLYEHLN